VSWVVPGEGLHLGPLPSDDQPAVASPMPGALLLPVRLQVLRHLGDVRLLRLAGTGPGPAAEFQIRLTGPQALPLQQGQALALWLDLAMVHIMPLRTGAGTALPAFG
jgi:hypothetical protein